MILVVVVVVQHQLTVMYIDESLTGIVQSGVLTCKGAPFFFF